MTIGIGATGTYAIGTEYSSGSVGVTVSSGVLSGTAVIGAQAPLVIWSPSGLAGTGTLAVVTISTAGNVTVSSGVLLGFGATGAASVEVDRKSVV